MLTANCGVSKVKKYNKFYTIKKGNLHYFLKKIGKRRKKRIFNEYELNVKICYEVIIDLHKVYNSVHINTLHKANGKLLG